MLDVLLSLDMLMHPVSDAMPKCVSGCLIRDAARYARRTKAIQHIYLFYGTVIDSVYKPLS